MNASQIPRENMHKISFAENMPFPITYINYTIIKCMLPDILYRIIVNSRGLSAWLLSSLRLFLLFAQFAVFHSSLASSFIHWERFRSEN